jgi:hypothetical protein
LTTKYEHLQLLIVDEISIEDHKFLIYLHGVGNVIILAVDDFYQLLPLKTSPLYKINDSVILDICWTPIFRIATLSAIIRRKTYNAKFAKMLTSHGTYTLHDEPMEQTDKELPPIRF